MDLHYSQTGITTKQTKSSFTTLWIYTILKPNKVFYFFAAGFTTLWIYTILKPVSVVFVAL